MTNASSVFLPRVRPLARKEKVLVLRESSAAFMASSERSTVAPSGYVYIAGGHDAYGDSPTSGTFIPGVGDHAGLFKLEVR